MGKHPFGWCSHPFRVACCITTWHLQIRIQLTFVCITLSCVLNRLKNSRCTSIFFAVDRASFSTTIDTQCPYQWIFAMYPPTDFLSKGSSQSGQASSPGNHRFGQHILRYLHGISSQSFDSGCQPVCGPRSALLWCLGGRNHKNDRRISLAADAMNIDTVKKECKQKRKRKLRNNIVSLNHKGL